MARPPKRHDAVTKIDAAVLRKARIGAAARDVGLAEYLSEALRQVVERDLARVIASESAEQRAARNRRD